MEEQQQLEYYGSQETPTPNFMPIIPRLDRLVEKLGLSSTACINKSLSSALQEVHRKGTIMQRLSNLETRIFLLSMEMDQGNTSKSSSSILQLSTITANPPSLVVKKRDDEPPPGGDEAWRIDAFENDQKIQLKKAQGEKRKARKKWQGLCRFGCRWL